MKVQLLTLEKAQVESIAELLQTHTSPAHIYQYSNRTVVVEFEFPYRYVIARNGRAIQEAVVPPMPTGRI